MRNYHAKLLPTSAFFLALIVFIFPLLAVAKDYRFVGPFIETSKVNESGKRHDEQDISCLNVASGELFKQASFKTSIEQKNNADEATCTVSFSNYVELLPGITEPTRACLRSFVKSVGGIFNFGKSGSVKCAMTYSTHEGVGISANMTPMSRNAVTSLPGIPAAVTLEKETRSLITASVPLAAIQFQVDKAVKDPRKSGLPPGFTLRVMSSRFELVTSGSPQLGYYVDIDVDGPIGARCEITSRFAIPASDIRNLIVQDTGSTADCRTGSLIGQLANLPTTINNAIRNAIADALGKQLFKDSSTFDDWAKEDPDWAALVLKAIVQGSYCDWRGQPALCIRVGWVKRDEINAWERSLLSKVPLAGGPIDKLAAEKKLAEFLADATQNRQNIVNGIKYPTGRAADNTIEDGDMAIFGGLLCRSGEPLGCELIRNVATVDGRFWRSPRRINEADTDSHASFSGDQLKGVLHYISATSDGVRLAKFLKYLQSKPTKVPDESKVLESGYSSCPNFAPNFTCLLAGGDWYALKLLARKHQLTASLPPDLPLIESNYGFSYDVLLWESLITNNGYRLHLIANTAWILRTLGETDPAIANTIRIIAARQPSNPFFAYLLHGADRAVQALTDAQCKTPSSRTEFSDWAWQRASAQEAWNKSMVWDCVFMYGLLTRDPMPASQ